MKPHSYFHVSTVPEPQPKVQQGEQVEILPAPGEISCTSTESNKPWITWIPFCGHIFFLCISSYFDVVARVCYANASQCVLLVFNKQINILKTWFGSELFLLGIRFSGPQVPSVAYYWRYIIPFFHKLCSLSKTTSPLYPTTNPLTTSTAPQMILMTDGTSKKSQAWN